jgi:hypothetical protein
MATDLRTGATKDTDDSVYDFPYRRPEDLGWVENWKKEIWNPETRQVLGRTGKSWGEFMNCKLAPYSVNLFT